MLFKVTSKGCLGVKETVDFVEADYLETDTGMILYFYKDEKLVTSIPNIDIRISVDIPPYK